MKALSSCAIELAPAAAVDPLRVEESAAGLRVFTDTGAVCLGADGVLTLGKQAAPLTLGSPIRNARVIFKGVNVVLVAADGRQLLIWRNGRVRLLSSQAETFKRPPGAELFFAPMPWVFALARLRAWGVGSPTTCRHWPTPWSRRRTGPCCWIPSGRRRLVASCSARPRGDPVQLATGVITMTPGTAALEVDLAAVASAEQGEALYETAMPLLLLRAGRAELPDENGIQREIRVEDVDANGSDFHSDRFAFLRAGQTTAVIQARAPYLVYYAAARSNALQKATWSARPLCWKTES